MDLLDIARKSAMALCVAAAVLKLACAYQHAGENKLRATEEAGGVCLYTMAAAFFGIM
jgi:hypothetical protein